MAIEIVSFPIRNGGSFHSYVALYQRVIVDDVDLLQWLNPATATMRARERHQTCPVVPALGSSGERIG